LKQVESGQGTRTDILHDAADTKLTRTEAARKAGLSERHINTTRYLLLLQVKASLNHGEWLPWLNAEIESGRLTVAERTVHNYMRIARNSHRDANLTEAPSIRAALELLSDKEPEQQQGELIDVEAERRAREQDSWFQIGNIYQCYPHARAGDAQKTQDCAVLSCYPHARAGDVIPASTAKPSRPSKRTARDGGGWCSNRQRA